MLKLEHNYHDIQKEFKSASKAIRQANKNMQWKVKINKDFRITHNCGQNWFRLHIFYTDGDLKEQVHTVAI